MRTAEFDRDKVLRSAMNEFMAKGYTKTSMQDLKRATGLHPGSIYCAFENKRGLMIAALEHYSSQKVLQFEQFFSEDTSILNGFNRYLNDIIHQCKGNEEKACLLQKSLSELQGQDEVIESLIKRMLDYWKQCIREKLDRAKVNQEISPDSDCDFLSDYVMLSIYGLRSFSQTNPESSHLEQLANTLMSTLKAS